MTSLPHAIPPHSIPPDGTPPHGIPPHGISVETTVLILLAAGRSTRFGDIGSKLTEPFLNRPLGLHVAVALQGMPFLERLAIVDGARLDYGRHGFTQIHNEDPGEGMSRSVRLGVAHAQAMGAHAVLIALADMPRVTATHIYRMFDAVDGPGAVVASSDGTSPRPPALFGRAQFAALLALEGEDGAREMVLRGRHVVASPAELIDVDTPEELAQLRALVHDPVTHRITRDGAHRSD